MDDDALPRRGFQPISVEIAGVQLGSSRFTPDHPAPACARMRNNLTALSQYRNLYFVACRDCIYIYEPRFPAQSVSDEPILILKLPVTEKAKPGYISTKYPHAVNRLLIDDLGDEETLGCVCDDGDVLLYHVRAMVKAIQERKDIISPVHAGRPKLAEAKVEAHVDVRPFYHVNVGSSAWGIAMHKTRRMLAVSNNLHVIDVIAFALIDPTEASNSALDDDEISLGSQDEETDDEDEDDEESLSMGPTPVITPNTHLCLRGHEANIPNVAFCSNDWDTKARWLVSTDIDGYMIIWNIWEQSILVRFQLGSTSVNPRPWDPDWEPSKQGWGVLCIDRTAGLKTGGFRETFGMSEGANKSHVIDITKTRDDVHSASDRFEVLESSPDAPTMAGPALSDDGNDDVSPLSDTLTDDEVNMLLVSEEFTQALVEETSTNAMTVDGGEGDLVAGSPSPDGDVEEAEDQEEDDDDEDDDDEMNEATHQHTDAMEEDETDEDELIAEEEAEEEAEEATEDLELDEVDSITHQHHTLASSTGSIYDNVTVAVSHSPDASVMSIPNVSTRWAKNRQLGPPAKLAYQAGFPRFAVLHTSETSVRLLPTPFYDLWVVCRRPFLQYRRGYAQHLDRYERLNMVIEVPELSLVVIACQTGRVALFRVTRGEDRPLGLRLEHLLPTEDQEDQGHRPNCPLLGIAIGPIQGREKPFRSVQADVSANSRSQQQRWRRVEGTRRYRLMLTYFNHTIISYEIGRAVVTPVMSNNPNPGFYGRTRIPIPTASGSTNTSTVTPASGPALGSGSGLDPAPATNPSHLDEGMEEFLDH